MGSRAADVLGRLDVVAIVNAAIDRLNNRPLGLGGLRAIGTAANQAAPGTVAANDFLVKTASTTLSAERVVTDTSSVTWDWSTPGQAKATVASGGGSPLTTKGDLYTFSTVNTRLPVGADGLPLVANSGAATGLNYAALGATGGGTAQSTWTLGDLLYASAANTLSRLAGNTTTTKKFLRQTGDGAASAAPAWDTVTKTDVGLGNVENTALSTWTGSANLATTKFADNSFAGSVQTTDATVTTCASFTPTDGKTSAVTVTVAAHKTDHTAGDFATLIAAFYRNGGTVTQIGSTTAVVATSTWTATLDVSGTSVRVRVTGAVATTINWRATATITEA